MKLPKRLTGQVSWVGGVGWGWKVSVLGERELLSPQLSQFPRFLKMTDNVSAAFCKQLSTLRRGARLRSLVHCPGSLVGVLGWLLTPSPLQGSHWHWALGGRRAPHGPGV